MMNSLNSSLILQLLANFLSIFCTTEIGRCMIREKNQKGVFHGKIL